MSRVLQYRPSPALVVACIALAVALGGTSYAAIMLPANSVGTKQLKKNAVKRSKIAAKAVDGSKVAPDSLTGANILESSLGTVPAATNATNANHANSADNASHASSADTVNGAKPSKVFWAVNSPSGPATILDTGGLQLLATCSGGNITLLAKTTVDDAEIHAHPLAFQFVYFYSHPDSGGDTVIDSQGGTTVTKDDNFDVGETRDVLDNVNTGSDSMSTLVNYATPAGSVVTVQLLAEEGGFGGPGIKDCVIAGTALQA